MKAIPINELIALLGIVQKEGSRVLFADKAERLFEVYGDDYFAEMGGCRMEKTQENALRAKTLEAHHAIIGKDYVLVANNVPEGGQYRCLKLS